MLPAPSASNANEDAYSLLSRPTLQLTDAQVEKIVIDLRERRAKHIATGKPDKPRAEAKIKAEPLGKESKAANTAALLASLRI
jgi:hypothetical protein